jgi:hypothetical protein
MRTFTPVHMKIPSQKQRRVSQQAAEMLLRKQHRRNKVIGVTLELRAAKPQHDLVILIEVFLISTEITGCFCARRELPSTYRQIPGRPLPPPLSVAASAHLDGR